MIPLKTQAIQKALSEDWDKAITLNQQILEENPGDIEALNRLALAFTELGKIKEAKKRYQKVLSLDSQNLIASKNLKRLLEIPTKKRRISKINTNNKTVAKEDDFNNMFLEEGGKTKMVELVNIAESKVISLLRVGKLLTLSIKRLKIYVLDENKQYIGMLPDDIAKRLIRFIKGGNLYQAHIKAAENHRVTIFIRETKRVNKFKNQPSFLTIGKAKNLILNYSNLEEETKEEQENQEGE